MNFMMAGMAPVMSFLMMGRDMRAMEPTELLFWGVMSIGVIAGFALAYPANVWLVARGLKHGLMTEREKAAEAGARPTREQQARMQMQQANAGGHGHYRQGDGPASGKGGAGHHMRSDATAPQIAALGMASLVALAMGMIAPANWLKLTLSARDVGGVIMPRGMIMDRDTPADMMRAAADPRLVTASYGLAAKGDQELPFRTLAHPAGRHGRGLCP